MIKKKTDSFDDAILLHVRIVRVRINWLGHPHRCCVLSGLSQLPNRKFRTYHARHPLSSSCCWNEHFEELQRPQQRPKNQFATTGKWCTNWLAIETEGPLENCLAISRKSLPLFLRIQFSLRYASFRSTFGTLFLVRGGYLRANAIIISHCSVLIKTEISLYVNAVRRPPPRASSTSTPLQINTNMLEYSKWIFIDVERRGKR